MTSLPAGGFLLPVAHTNVAFKQEEGYVYFGSNSKDGFHLLSNFSTAPVPLAATDVTAALLRVSPLLKEWVEARGGRVIFPTSEHAWQALKAGTSSAFGDFLADGRLGSLRVTAFLPFAPKQSSAAEQQAWAQGKVDHWAKKGNIGILAKMAANRAYAKALAYVPDQDMHYRREHLAADEERAVWLDILRLKYRANPDHMAKLTSTGGAYLLEHVRGATRNPEGEHWGGCYDKESGKIVGQNVMGRYLMALRAELCTE